MRPTVHDIAAAAGVSLATVDRVLNQRPGVRRITREKVETAIREIGYVRDVAAANLAKGRTYPLVFILPASDNSFMHGLHAEIREAMIRSPSERTRYSHSGGCRPSIRPPWLRRSKSLPMNVPPGLRLSPPTHLRSSLRLTGSWPTRIPVVTLVSDLTGSRRHHYAGVDNIAAGKTAARLLGRFLGDAKGEVAVLAGSMLVRDHRERLEGFAALMAQEFPKLSILPVLEGRDDPELAHMLVADVLSKHERVIGVYSLGAGNRGLVRALKARASSRPLTVVAHELTVHTRAALIDGTIDAILNQNAGHEVRSAIRVLKAKADGLAVIDAQERIRLDIFLKDNLP